VSATLRAAAQATGERLGQQACLTASCRPTAENLVAAVCGVLESEGYEPRVTFDRITLTNCPFQGLAKDYTGLVCGMNLHLMRGLVGGLDDERLQARLDPATGRCCVTLTRPRD
jgi:predicted ArsR family transcriptional regulator